MNLFNDLESLRGENLASAILRHLIISSPEIRHEILLLVDKRSPIGPLVSDSHFSCYLESSANSSANHSRGRVDMVLELDNAIVGIEVKFHADFQEDQPFKYFEMLEDRAEALKELRGAPEYEYFILVLVPKSRVGEVKKAIKNPPAKWEKYKSRCRVLSWANIRKALQRAENRVPAEIAHLSKTYRSFLDDRLSLFRDWERKKRHAIARWQSRGTTLQADILRDLFHVVDAEITSTARCRLLSAGAYLVQKIEVSHEEEPLRTLYYGFCKKGAVSGEEGLGADFFVLTTAIPEYMPDTNLLVPHGEAHGFRGWTTKRINHAWTVNLKKIGGDPKTWSQLLSPFTNALVASSENPDSGSTRS